MSLLIHMWRCPKCGLLYGLAPPSMMVRDSDSMCKVCSLTGNVRLEWLGTRSIP